MNSHQMPSATLLIGIGNEYRGDDAIGLWIAEQVAAQKIPHLTVKKLQSECTRLFDQWEGFERVVLVDAISSRRKPGTYVFLTPKEISAFRKQCAPSTHLYGVLDAIELAQMLGKLPPKLLFCGIEVKTVAMGGKLSREVLVGAREVMHFLIHEFVVPLGGK